MPTNNNVKLLRPMLAEDGTEEAFQRLIKAKGFLYASWKIDGIRCVNIDGVPKTRSLKDIPNIYTRKFLTSPLLAGLDGELVSGTPYGQDTMQRSTSAFMSHAGDPHFMWHLFDDRSLYMKTFKERFEDLKSRVKALGELLPRFCLMHIEVLEQFEVRTYDHLLRLEKEAIDRKYEGLIVRAPDAPYKAGRSTLKEGFMLKMKRFADSEAEVIGFEEMMHNQNEAKLDERGFTKRSTEQAGKVPSGMLGALQVRDLKQGWAFNIGTGFDHSARQAIWSNRNDYLGKVVKYKFLRVGMVDVPRHPTFLAWRDKKDM